MKIFFRQKIIFILFCHLLTTPAFGAEKSTQVWKYHNYKVVRKSVDELNDKIVITKDDHVVFELTDIANHLSFLNEKNPIPYSNDLRKKAINLIKKGKKQTEIAELL